MTDVLVIGASGNVGKMATQQLLENEFTVKALVRDASKLSDIDSDNLSICERDLEDDFSDVFHDCHQVVFAAGSGGSTGADKTLLIDLWAARNAVEYAKSSGTQRFVMLSSVGADAPDDLPSDIKPYLVAKHMADQHLITSGLRYTLLRPGTLLDEKGAGMMQNTMPKHRNDAVISREDVATAIRYAVGSPASDDRIIALYRGSHPIKSFF
ncbi:SDR family oxidoreductase [Alteromonas sp. 14N.309.X.WAT.G.H12]|uniref:SDR family oxidoreductase n=1 Tax=Alteromonas sp. 14N.309.X.WAT.G.H12 TaxID=3120824 RepID=UPI002FD388C6